MKLWAPTALAASSMSFREASGPAIDLAHQNLGEELFALAGADRGGLP